MTFPAWGDVPTWGLFAGAIVTAVFAIMAFGKQSEEVRTLDRQARDQQELTRQQGELLKIQSEQLELQRRQVEEQRAVIAKQTDVLELQARELQASLEQRERETAERHRAQAVRVFMWEEGLDRDPDIDQATLSARGERPTPVVVARVRNASNQPIYDLGFSWHRGTAPHRHGEAMLPVMPRSDAYATCPVPDDLPESSRGLFGAVAFFRDAAGTYWRARPDGQLDEIQPGEEPPHSW
jgi:gas vesicle protein